MKKQEKLFKVGDIVVIAALLLVSLLIFLSSLPTRNKTAAEAVICVDGEEYGRYSLSRDREIVIEQEGHRNTVEIKDGKVFMKEADCPDRSCVRQGKITKNGEVIVCLPARITVTLDGAREQVDAVVY